MMLLKEIGHHLKVKEVISYGDTVTVMRLSCDSYETVGAEELVLV